MPQHPFNWQIKAPVCSDGAGAFSLIWLSPLSWFIYAYPHSLVCPSIYFFVLSLQQLLLSLAVVEACYANNLHGLSRMSFPDFFSFPYENVLRKSVAFLYILAGKLHDGALSSVSAVHSSKLHRTTDMINCIKQREYWAGVTMEVSWAPLLNSPLAWDSEHQVLGTGIFLMASAKPNWFASPDCMALSRRFCEGWQCNNIICKTLRTATVLLDGSKASAGGTSFLKWWKEWAFFFSPPCHSAVQQVAENGQVLSMLPCDAVRASCFPVLCCLFHT